MFKKFMVSSNSMFFIENQIEAINQYCEYQAQFQAKLEYLNQNHHMPDILCNIKTPCFIIPKQRDNPDAGCIYLRLDSISLNNTIQCIFFVYIFIVDENLCDDMTNRVNNILSKFLKPLKQKYESDGNENHYQISDFASFYDLFAVYINDIQIYYTQYVDLQNMDYSFNKMLMKTFNLSVYIFI